MKYFFIGEYNQKPVYYSQETGIVLEERLDSLIEPTKQEIAKILSKFGGVRGIELLIKHYAEQEKRVKNGK